MVKQYEWSAPVLRKIPPVSHLFTHHCALTSNDAIETHNTIAQPSASTTIVILLLLVFHCTVHWLPISETVAS